MLIHASGNPIFWIATHALRAREDVDTYTSMLKVFQHAYPGVESEIAVTNETVNDAEFSSNRNSPSS